MSRAVFITSSPTYTGELLISFREVSKAGAPEKFVTDGVDPGYINAVMALTNDWVLHGKFNAALASRICRPT